MPITRTWTVNPTTGRLEVTASGSRGVGDSRTAGSVADPGGTLTVNASTHKAYACTALSAATTIAAPTGSPTDGMPLIIRLKDNGTARALTWNAIFRVVGVTLPTTTVLGKVHYIGAMYNANATKWDVLAVGAEA